MIIQITWSRLMYEFDYLSHQQLTVYEMQKLRH
jgi:hypothetical protein